MNIIIKPEEIKNYYSATGIGYKKDRKLNNKHLVDYLTDNFTKIELELCEDSKDEIAYMKLHGECLSLREGYIVEYLINQLCNGGVRFENSIYDGYADVIEFEFE